MKAAETCTYFVTKFKFQTVLEKQHKAADYVHSYKCYMCACRRNGTSAIASVNVTPVEFLNMTHHLIQK